MKSFAAFINESVRVGLPHLASHKPGQPSLDTHQFKALTKGGHVHIHDVTEKTDGQTLVMGHDEHGFYTQHSGSGNEKIRHASGHIERAKKRAAETGKPYDGTAPTAFAHFHQALHDNEALQKHLKSQYEKTGKPVVIRGEAFNKHLSSPSESKKGEVKFVHTSYDPSHMGSVGKFIIHHKLPENQHHDTEYFKSKLSTSKVNFDDDKIHHKPHSIDVKDEVKHFHSLNHDLINSRTTPKNKEAKLAEVEKFNDVKKKVYHKVLHATRNMGISKKWGSESEGIVVHPPKKNPDAPRFKVVDPEFTKKKEAGGRFGH